MKCNDCKGTGEYLGIGICVEPCLRCEGSGVEPGDTKLKAPFIGGQPRGLGEIIVPITPVPEGYGEPRDQAVPSRGPFTGPAAGGPFAKGGIVDRAATAAQKAKAACDAIDARIKASQSYRDTVKAIQKAEAKAERKALAPLQPWWMNHSVTVFFLPGSYFYVLNGKVTSIEWIDNVLHAVTLSSAAPFFSTKNIDVSIIKSIVAKHSGKQVWPIDHTIIPSP